MQPSHSSLSLAESNPQAPLSRPSWATDLWRLGIILGPFFFAFLGSRPLNNPDEGRYAEIPREMALSGDYVTPRLNGVKYFEKPPLVYWLSAATFRTVGISEWSARFWCAAFAVFGALITYAAGRALYDATTGLFAAGVLSSSFLYYGLSRIILLDLVVGVFIASALFAFVVGIRLPPGSQRRFLFAGFYGCMALATLTKGMIGFVLPGAVAFVWLAALKQWYRLRPFYPISGTVLFLAIAVPWHWAAARANDDFAYFYFVHEHLLRFTTQAHGRHQPWWFFIPVLVGGLFPWIVFAGQSVRRGITGGWRERGANAEAWFLVMWIVVIVGFFSKSQSKLVPYIAPVLPAAALLIGRYLAEGWRESTRGVRIGLSVFAGIAGVVAVAVVVVRIPQKYSLLAAVLEGWRIGVASVLAATGVAVVWLMRRGSVRHALVAMATGTAVLLVGFNFLAGAIDLRSTKSLALALRSRIEPGDSVFCVGEYFQDFPVYLNRLVDVVDYEGELAFGIQSEPKQAASRFIDGDTFARRWREAPVAYALVPRRKMDTWFAARTLPRTVVAETSDAVLLLNQQPVAPAALGEQTKIVDQTQPMARRRP